VIVRRRAVAAHARPVDRPSSRKSYVISDPYDPGLNAAMTLAPCLPQPDVERHPTAEPHQLLRRESAQAHARRGSGSIPKSNVSGSMYSALVVPSSRRNQREP
jgi:hypothetical protein